MRSAMAPLRSPRLESARGPRLPGSLLSPSFTHPLPAGFNLEENSLHAPDRPRLAARANRHVPPTRRLGPPLLLPVLVRGVDLAGQEPRPHVVLEPVFGVALDARRNRKARPEPAHEVRG